MSDTGFLEGASLFLLYAGQVLYGVKRIERRDGTTVALLTGIGGKVEPGETYRQCALREAQEEIGATPRLVAFRKTFLIDETGLSGTATVPDNPLAVVTRPVPGHAERLRVHLFGASLAQEPEPIENLRHLLLIPPAELGRVSADQPPLCAILAAGGRVISRDPAECPPEARLRFVDSPETYVPYLAPRAAKIMAAIQRGYCAVSGSRV